MWAALMFRFSGSGYVCAFWCFWSRSKLPGDETVSEMLNATAMMESPQRRSLLSPEQHPPNGETFHQNLERKFAPYSSITILLSLLTICRRSSDERES